MSKHIFSLTYKPKIEGVLDDTIKQTIRAGNKIEVGDSILFHGWEGRPYRSKWSWRKEVTVTKVYSIIMSKDGIQYNKMWFYKYEELNELAKKDGINPPTGEELGRILCEIYGKDMPCEGQIIKWK